MDLFISFIEVKSDQRFPHIIVIKTCEHYIIMHFFLTNKLNLVTLNENKPFRSIDRSAQKLQIVPGSYQLSVEKQSLYTTAYMNL